MASHPLGREITIRLRVQSAQRALIDRAAQLSGKSRTDFMLEAACEKARLVMRDRTTVTLEDAGFRRFAALLDTPVDNGAALMSLLKRCAPWETNG
jgi:uncharacterized protein (DUF1778 family)